MRKLVNSVTRLAATLSLVLAYTSFIAAQGTAALPTNDQITAKVEEYMKAVLEIGGFSGTILIARDGKPIVSKGYGMANVELNVPNTPDKIFRLGSITKQFTGMAIAMLHSDWGERVAEAVDKAIAGAGYVGLSLPLVKGVIPASESGGAEGLRN